ncbi:MAG: hypothetical protein VST70_08735 [Nitrospirota bacterium]|nr:hypothetical protein [Nitrospirota bacterium]
MKAGTMSKGLLMAAAIFLIGFSAVPKAEANMMHGCHHNMMKHMMMHGGPIPFYLMNQDRLGLSANQVKTLIRLKMSFRKTAIMEKAHIRILHEEIMAEMMHRKIDTADVQKDMDAILSHKKTIMHSYLDMLSKAHRTLTPDQFTKVKGLWREMMLMHHGMEEGHHRM